MHGLHSRNFFRLCLDQGFVTQFVKRFAEGTENKKDFTSKTQCVFLCYLCAQQVVSQILEPDTTLPIIKRNREPLLSSDVQ